ncbi:MAG: hypothetical protein DRQ46_00270 [Gammaproteobacteria bacterium]|nr:MAG: hypothetical protein DRQ46_00270 [Gammaproteobacteria bacterium]
MELKEVFKDGIKTSEFATAKAHGWFAIVIMIIGVVIAFSAQITGIVEGTAAATWVGGIMAAIAFAGKTLTDLGYMKTRADVKRAAAEIEMTKNVTPPNGNGE